MSLEAALQRLWYGPAWWSLPLWPLSALFRSAVATRRALYRAGLLPTQHVAAPVVVVGNLTVGGTGKTPVAAWLARKLALRGHRVGVVLRGYGGRGGAGPRVVTADSDPAEVGDEALLHALRGTHVVVVGADRVAAARRAVAEGAAIVVCDDGLQHLRLGRDYEVAVVDAVRGFGNRRMLPAGPLREPARRLDRVDAVLFTQRGPAVEPPLAMSRPFTLAVPLRLGDAVNLLSGERRPLEAFRDRPLHAVAAVGHPAAFFEGLRSTGLAVQAHPLPDHAALDPRALPFPPAATVLMTEKDAVKCRSFAGADWWFVELGAAPDRMASDALLARILERAGLTGAGVELG